MFPCYSLVFGFNNILLNDSSYRRDFLDNGMFHVEPEAVKITLGHEKCLKQRNFILKSKKYSLLQTWDDQLAEQNLLLTNMRVKYFDSLNREFNMLINEIKNTMPSVYNEVSTLSLEYIKGWSGIDYSKQLESLLKKIKLLATQLVELTEAILQCTYGKTSERVRINVNVGFSLPNNEFGKNECFSRETWL